MCAVNQHSPLCESLNLKAGSFNAQAANKALSNRSLLCIPHGLNDELALISP